ncbi:MAG: HTTM domain-containing protein [Acidimicrobiales bacterium]
MGTSPVDGSGLRLLRVVVGLVAAATCARVIWHGWIDTLWTGTPGRLAYPLLGWVPMPARPVLIVLVVACGLAGLAAALGVAERLSLAFVTAGMLWLGTLDAAAYLNHEVLLVALAGLLALLPAGRTVPPAAVLAVRVVVASVYLWAAVAKLDAAWVAGDPLRVWLASRAGIPLIGPLLVRPGTAALLAGAGLAFDATVVPALAWRRTRPWALGAVVAFHLATAVLFPVGAFPWLMVGAALGAFPPRLLRWVPALRYPERARWPAMSRLAAAGIIGLCALAPLRAVLPGSDPAWDGTGDHLAWRVMDHDRAGFVRWVVRDRATGATWDESPDDHLAPHQQRQLASTVSLLPGAARAVRADWARQGRDVEVRAQAYLSLDGGRAHLVVDPSTDLSRVGWTLGHPAWAVRGA